MRFATWTAVMAGGLVLPAWGQDAPKESERPKPRGARIVVIDRTFCGDGEDRVDYEGGSVTVSRQTRGIRTKDLPPPVSGSDGKREFMTKEKLCSQEGWT